jgi:hypothetical protein
MTDYETRNVLSAYVYTRLLNKLQELLCGRLTNLFDAQKKGSGTALSHCPSFALGGAK